MGQFFSFNNNKILLYYGDMIKQRRDYTNKYIFKII